MGPFAVHWAPVRWDVSWGMVGCSEVVLWVGARMIFLDWSGRGIEADGGWRCRLG